MPPCAVKNKRRYCRIPNCNKIVKSQGLCQAHGAKTRKCKVETCKKQAQGNFDGMCKSHFKSLKKQLIAVPPKESDLPRPASVSVYEMIIPDSLGWCGEGKLPLIQFLQEGFDEQRPRGWHRNEERRARGLNEVFNPAIQFECWERELVWMEICLLSGAQQASFRHLARAWGRDKGFHTVLAQFICQRHGDVERKQRGKEDSIVTKKAPRKAVTLNPGEDEIDVEWDQDDLEMFNAMEGDPDRMMMQWDEDPTVNFDCTKSCNRPPFSVNSIASDYCNDSSESDNESSSNDRAPGNAIPDNPERLLGPIATIAVNSPPGGDAFLSHVLHNNILPPPIAFPLYPSLMPQSMQLPFPQVNMTHSNFASELHTNGWPQTNLTTYPPLLNENSSQLKMMQGSHYFWNQMQHIHPPGAQQLTGHASTLLPNDHQMGLSTLAPSNSLQYHATQQEKPTTKVMEPLVPV